jgi:probable FeS assembly SUF system protein SufT
MHGREQVLIAREVEAIQIPEGTRIRLPEGMEVLITQELGGSFTIMTSRGLMYRIDQNDADALGKEVTEVEFDDSVAETKEAVEERIWEQMKKCYDPEIPVNVVDLGLIYDCDVEASPNGGHSVEVKMTLTAPGCGMGPVLAEDVKNRVQEVPGVEQVHVEVVFDPPWNPNMMTEAARLQLGFM